MSCLFTQKYKYASLLLRTLVVTANAFRMPRRWSFAFQQLTFKNVAFRETAQKPVTPGPLKSLRKQWERRKATRPSSVHNAFLTATMSPTRPPQAQWHSGDPVFIIHKLFVPDGAIPAT